MVFSTTRFELKDMAQDQLVRREPVSASCNQLDIRCPVVVTAAIPDTMLLPTDTGDQLIRDVLQPVVPHFDNHPLATRPVYMDDNARPHRSV
jgi:hypothetical protein